MNFFKLFKEAQTSPNYATLEPDLEKFFDIVLGIISDQCRAEMISEHNKLMIKCRAQSIKDKSLCDDKVTALIDALINCIDDPAIAVTV